MSEQIDYKKQYEEAEAYYKEILEKERRKQKKKKENKLAGMSDADRKLIEEHQSTDTKGFGGGMRFLLFLCFSGVFVAIRYLFLENLQMEDGAFFGIAAGVSLVLSLMLVYLLNSKSRNRKKRVKELEEMPGVKEYLDYCRKVDQSESDELKEAHRSFKIAEQQFFNYVHTDTVLIFAPSSRTNDSISYFKYISVYIDGNMYCEQLRPGVTKVRIAPGYHHFRFEEVSKPRKSDGLAAAFREGRYGGSTTAGEYSCQIDMSSHYPVGIVLEGKDKYQIAEKLTADQYERFAAKV